MKYNIVNYKLVANNFAEILKEIRYYVKSEFIYRLTYLTSHEWKNL